MRVISLATAWLLTHLSNKHSSYSSSFPIYVFTQKTEEVPDEDPLEPSISSSESNPETTQALVPPEENEDQAIVEEITSDGKESAAESTPPKMKSVVVDEWVRLNAQPPLWTRFVVYRDRFRLC